MHNLQNDDESQITGVTSTLPGELPTETFSYDSLYNRIADFNGASTYDPKKLVLQEDWKYQYSSENQLLSVKRLEPGNPTPVHEVSFLYDPMGRRMEKRVIDRAAPSDAVKTFTRRYLYDSQEIFAETNGENALLARHTHSSLRTDDVLATHVTAAGITAGMAQAPGSYFYLKDHLGSVTDVVSSAGLHVLHYAYSAFGTIMGIQDAAANDVAASPPLRIAYTFAGREFDAETGLFYNRARYYDPGAGRFLQRDPHPGMLRHPGTVVNSYAYVLNNPLNLTDPSGKFIHLLFAAIGAIGAFLNSAIGGAIAVGVIGGVFNIFGADPKGSGPMKALSFLVGALTFGLGALAISALAVPLIAAGTVGTIAAGAGIAAGIGFSAGFLNNVGNQAIFTGKVDLERAAYAGVSSGIFTLATLGLGAALGGGLRGILVDHGGAIASGYCVDTGGVPQEKNEISFGVCPAFGF